MLKLAIFDMDGLLIDSEKVFLDAIKDVCEELGCQLNETYYREQMGAGEHPDEMRMFPGIDEEGLKRIHPLIYEKMWAAAREMWKKGAPVKPGADELISWLKEHGIPTAVASSSDRTRVENALKSAALYDRFDHVLCREEYEKGKPNPDVFLAACDRFHVRPEEAIVFEDSNSGGLAAYRAQIPYIIVPDLAIVTQEVLSRALAVVKSLADAVPVLSREYGVG